MSERLDRFARAGIDRLIVSPIQLDREERMHTIERLAALTGAATPA